ncbi:MAG: nucleotidyltransferase family protein [Gammaproteobacteria bacterium]|nr:nucleotidyltransferase family protein [Gammaproteobacteria bacterium]
MFLLALTNALDKHGVKYALVGGYAVALHGAVRGTVDVDIVIQLRQSVFNKAEQALIELGLQPRLPVSADDVFLFREEYIKNKNLIAWSFSNPDNPTEILDIIITEDLNNMKPVIKNVMGKNIKVADIASLIAMKTRSGRPQDIEDIKALKKILAEETE